MSTTPNPTSFLTKYFESFQYENTPFYIIVASAIFTLNTISSFRIENYKWWILFGIVAAVLIFVVFLCFYAKQKMDAEKHGKNLRAARTIGIAIAIICFLITGENGLNDTGTFLLVVLPCALQIIVFLALVVYKDIKSLPLASAGEEKEFRLNYLQLCIVTSALLIGLSVNGLISNKEEVESNISTLCLTEEITDLYDSVKSEEHSGSSDIEDIISCYREFKYIDTIFTGVSGDIDAYLNEETRRNIRLLRNAFLNLPQSQLYKDFFNPNGEYHSDLLDRIENSEDKQLVKFINSHYIYANSFSQLLNGYTKALEIKREFESRDELLNTCLSPRTDSIITSLITSFEKQQNTINSLSGCYEYVESLPFVGVEIPRNRFDAIFIIFILLWLICMLIWIGRLLS